MAMPSDSSLRIARWAPHCGAAVAGFQAILWAKIQFWVPMAGAALLTAVLACVAVRFRPTPGRSFRRWTALMCALVAMLAVLCFVPIRAGAISGRLIERVVLAVLAITALIALLMALRCVLDATLQRRGIRKKVLLPLGFVLLVLLTADLLSWARPSALSATACTTSLFRSKPDAGRLLDIHHDAITRQSALHDVPASLVAAIIVDHQNQQSASGDFSDCLGSALGVNLSLGLSQVRLGTAALVDGRSLADLSASEYRNLRWRLLNPESNIAYEARELRALMERTSRFPGMSASALLQNPAAMALLISEYRKGRMSTSIAESRLNINAFSALELMQDGTLARFDMTGEDSARVRSLIREYLGQIYCQSGIFNESACRNWRRRLASRRNGG